MSQFMHYDDLAKDDNTGTIVFDLPEKSGENAVRSVQGISLNWEVHESERVNISNLPWYMLVKRSTSEVKRKISVRLFCNDKCESTIWSCEATADFRLIRKSLRGDVQVVSKMKLQPFRFNYNNNTMKNYQDFKTIGSTSNDIDDSSFIKFTVEANITVRNIVGVRKRKRFEFVHQPSDPSHVALIVENKPVYVNKTFLGMYSPFFYTLFFSNFREKDKAEIELKDVEYDDFMELLKIIYPTQNDVREQTYEKMLELADRFQIESVIDKCEKFLISDKEIENSKKLLIAQNYKLSTLMNACIQKYKTIIQMRSIRSDSAYKFLNYDTKAALLERVFKLNDEGK